MVRLQTTSKQTSKGIPLKARILSVVAVIMALLLSLSGCGKKVAIELPETIEVSKYSTPGLKADGTPYTIAFMDEGPPIESSDLWFKGICEEMQSLGYISKNVDLTKAPTGIEEYYKYILNSDYGDKIKFCDTLYFVTEDNEEELKQTLKQRVANKEIDMFMVTGTYPGSFLKEIEIGVPFTVSFSADPISAGIIESREKTGNPDIWALVEPDPYKRQLDVYKDKFGFKKFGMLAGYNCDLKGGVPELKEEADKLGVEWAIEYIKEEGATKEEAIDAVNKLIDRGCEVVIFVYGALDSNDIMPSDIVDEIKGKGVPFIISDGEEHVKNGGLMMVAMFDYESYGHHTMKIVNNILNGEKAGDQPLIYISTPRIMLNLEAAKKLGYKTNFELLQQVDVLY